MGVIPPIVCILWSSCCLVKNDANIQCVSFLSFNLAILVFWIAAGSSSDNPVFSSVFCEQGFLLRCLAFRCSSQFAWHYLTNRPTITLSNTLGITPLPLDIDWKFPLKWILKTPIKNVCDKSNASGQVFKKN